MKRHPALVPLSRDHQQALVHARDLQQIGDHTQPGDRVAATRRFLSFWWDDVRHHFRREEELLLPLLARHGAGEHALLVRLQRDHLQIRSLVAPWIDPLLGVSSFESPPQAIELRELGQRLTDHVRFEEHEFFPWVETTLDPTELDRVSRALASQ